MGTQKNTETGKRPGVMLYFDMVEPIRSLRDAEKGRMLMAIVNYARDGVPPEFSGRLALAWGYIQPKLDRDAEVYETTVQKRKYAAICKKRAGQNLPKISFSQWKNLSEEELEHMDAHGNTWYPTGKGQGEETGDGQGEETGKETGEETGKGYGDAAAAGKGYGNASGSAAGADGPEAALATTAAERNLKPLGGELGQGVVNLTEYQMDRLLEQMGLEMFDYYVKKLSVFILKNGASVKNHYATILRWWQEDQCL